MQKVYLLLRNNAQTGPFDLHELLQFHLKPFDLIWIEGKSAGWYYPQEIEALRPHLLFLKNEWPQAATPPVQTTTIKTEPAAPKKIFVSMPAAVTREEIKPQAATVKEEVKPQVEARPQTTTMPSFNVEPKATSFAKTTSPEPAEVKTSYAKTLGEVETDYMNWAYQKKAAKKPLFSKSGIVVLCLLSVALFAVWKIANKPKADDATMASLSQPAVQTSLPSSPERNAVETKPAAQKNSLPPSSKKDKAGMSNAAVKTAEPVKQQAAMKHPTKDVVAGNDEANNTTDEPKPVVKEEPKPVTEDKTETATTEAPKKKKLRDKIFDIFRKKSEEKTEEAKPAENDNGNRSSTRREAGSSLTQLVTVRFEIPNSWMMGIKGAKATLSNKSSETISKAVVEVKYYNDDNELLDKKNVVFTNVKSKSTQTVSVPEHATATRLEYSVVSTVGAGDALAVM